MPVHNSLHMAIPNRQLKNGFLIFLSLEFHDNIKGEQGYDGPGAVGCKGVTYMLILLHPQCAGVDPFFKAWDPTEAKSPASAWQYPEFP
jgi:hypothetical protein